MQKLTRSADSHPSPKKSGQTNQLNNFAESLSTEKKLKTLNTTKF